MGYRSAEQTVEISPDKTIEVNFSLTEEALSVEEVVVSASRTETNKKTSPTIVSVASAKQLPVAMIERVEVIRGGGSALFGANAIGGVVNIITKEPLRNSVTLSNTTNIFEGGTADFNTSLNGSFVSDDYKMGVYLFGMIKDRDSYDRNGDGFSDIPKLNSETAGYRAYYKPSP